MKIRNKNSAEAENVLLMANLQEGFMGKNALKQIYYYKCLKY
jgi:hypothetical protein